MLSSFKEELRSAKSTLIEHGEVVPEIVLSDLTGLHVDLENVIWDIKVLNVNNPGDENYKLFRRNLDKASVEFSEIIQVYNAIMGMGEIKLWLESSTHCRCL